MFSRTSNPGRTLASREATFPLPGHAKAVTYATAIRKGGVTRGKVLGVPGIFFDWRTQCPDDGAGTEHRSRNDPRPGAPRCRRFGQRRLSANLVLSHRAMKRILDQAGTVSWHRTPLSPRRLIFKAVRSTLIQQLRGNCSYFSRNCQPNRASLPAAVRNTDVCFRCGSRPADS